MEHLFGRILQERLGAAPHCLAYTFTSENDEVTQVSYAQLLQRALQIGAAVCEYTRRGDRVILMVSPGIDYVASFLGCWIHGRVSVPAYPLRRNQRAARTENMIADARPKLVLIDGPDDALASLTGQVTKLLRRLPLCTLAPASTDTDIDGLCACIAKQTDGAPLEDLVFLQYTSGSTGSPKGTMVSHGNLLHNSQQMSRKFQTSSQSIMVSWLPPYHDMGLILGVLQPLFVGFPCHLMAPAAFMQRPMLWLQLIASTRATISGGPNFAFDLCVRRAAQLGAGLLDLSLWRVAFNGAEPIHAGTLRRFAAAFAPHGFDPRALHPCYGLAENTLMVTGQDPLPPDVLSPLCFVRELTEESGAAGIATSVEVVDSGSGIDGQVIHIVDPETQVACKDGELGEIWVSGPSVARGYWNNEAATAAIFHATPVGAEPSQRFLRTGDLGQLIGGRLYIRGRVKDLIIVRGVKYYPQDIERYIEQARPEIRPGGYCAVLQSNESQVESVSVVAELAREHRRCNHEDLIGAIRAVVVGEFGLRVLRVALLPPGRFPKTSSGKIPRKLIAREFLHDELLAQNRQLETEGAYPAHRRHA